MNNSTVLIVVDDKSDSALHRELLKTCKNLPEVQIITVEEAEILSQLPVPYNNDLLRLAPPPVLEMDFKPPLTRYERRKQQRKNKK